MDKHVHGVRPAAGDWLPLGLVTPVPATSLAHDVRSGAPDLSAALAALGNAAATATMHRDDIRLHVLACQAHHLAEQMPGAARGAARATVNDGSDAVADAARQVRHALGVADAPGEMEATLAWLLSLADGVRS